MQVEWKRVIYRSCSCLPCCHWLTAKHYVTKAGLSFGTCIRDSSCLKRSVYMTGRTYFHMFSVINTLAFILNFNLLQRRHVIDLSFLTSVFIFASLSAAVQLLIICISMHFHIFVQLPGILCRDVCVWWVSVWIFYPVGSQTILIYTNTGALHKYQRQILPVTGCMCK